jgi:DNA-binding GntR family transcriptional regulator
MRSTDLEHSLKAAKGHIRPVVRVRLFHEVCERLREILPRLEPGMRLQEIELAKMLGVSRTPVREALVRLASEGLVELLPGGGCRVLTLDRRDVREVSDVRIALEGMAARTLAPKITSDQLRELARLAKAADGTEMHPIDRQIWDEAERAFHNRFIEMADNRQLAQILSRHRVLERSLTLPLSDWQHRAQSDPGPSHVALVQALESRDPQRCEAIFRQHAETRKAWLLECVENLEAQNGEQSQAR